MKIPDLLLKSDFMTQYEAGQVIFREGDPGDSLLVLLEGQVELTIKNGFSTTFAPVEILGEMALIDGLPRSATMVAKTRCKLARMNQQRFDYLVRQRPEFAWEVMRTLVERLRWTGAIPVSTASAPVPVAASASVSAPASEHAPAAQSSASSNPEPAKAPVPDNLKQELYAIKTSLDSASRQIAKLAMKLPSAMK